MFRFQIAFLKHFLFIYVFIYKNKLLHLKFILIFKPQLSLSSLVNRKIVAFLCTTNNVIHLWVYIIVV